MNGKTLYKILGGITIIVIVVGIYWWQRGDALPVQLPSNQSTTAAEALRMEIERVTQYELENGCVETDPHGQEILCGASKSRVDALHAEYRRIIKAGTVPDQETQELEKQHIKTFMYAQDKDIELTYIESRSPGNFTVGITRPSGNGGGVTDVPDEWQRSVNIYRSESPTGGTCQIYEFEIDQKSHHVVQAQTAYTSAYEEGECEKTEDLFSPAIPEWEIREVYAEGILNSGGVPNYEFGMHNNTRIKDDFVITHHSDRWEWLWEDTSYQLPEGLSGGSAVDSRPTVRLLISDSGKLLQYNNTIPLFQ